MPENLGEVARCFAFDGELIGRVRDRSVVWGISDGLG